MSGNGGYTGFLRSLSHDSQEVDRYLRREELVYEVGQHNNRLSLFATGIALVVIGVSFIAGTVIYEGFHVLSLLGPVAWLTIVVPRYRSISKELAHLDAKYEGEEVVA